MSPASGVNRSRSTNPRTAGHFPARQCNAQQAVDPLHRPGRPHVRLLHHRDRLRRQRPADTRFRPANRPNRVATLCQLILAVSPNPYHVCPTIDVTFSEPINTSSLTSGVLTLTDDGGPNLINGGVSLSLVSGDTYAIGGLMGLTSAQGEYTLTVNAADIQDQNGVAGTNSLFTSWLMDTSAPSSHVVNSLGTSQTSDTFPVSVTFSDPAGPGNAPASGVSAVQLWVSVNNGAFSLYQTMDITPTASGTVTFSFTGQDRNIYAFHSIAIDAAGNAESKSSTATEASTSVPDLHPPVTQVLTTSTYNNAGSFTINWSEPIPTRTPARPPARSPRWISMS